jgi:ABC-type glycerol-3-phosphate transport system substrate-binding protein
LLGKQPLCVRADAEAQKCFGGGALFDANSQPVFTASSRDATIRWLDWLRSLHTNPNVLATPDFSMLDAEIQQGRILSVIDWAHKQADYEQLWRSADAVGVAPLPSVGAGQPRTVVLAEVACINAVTSPEQRAAAEAFLRFSISPDAQRLLAEQSRGLLLPVQQAATADTPAAAVWQGAQGAQTLTSQINAWKQPLDEMVRSVVSNGTSAAEAVDAAGATIQP